MKQRISRTPQPHHGQDEANVATVGTDGGDLDIPRLAGSRIAVVGVPCSGKSTFIGKLFPTKARVFDVRNYRSGPRGQADYLTDLTSVMEIGDDLREKTSAPLTVVETVPFYEPYLAPFNIKLHLFPSDTQMTKNREKRYGDCAPPSEPNRCELTTYMILGNPQCGKSELAEKIIKVAHPEGRKLYIFTLPSTLPNIARILRHRRLRRKARWETISWENLERARGSGYSVMVLDGATKVLTADPAATRKFFDLARSVAEVLILVLKGDPNDLVEDPVVGTCYKVLSEMYPNYFNSLDSASFRGIATGKKGLVKTGDSNGE